MADEKQISATSLSLADEQANWPAEWRAHWQLQQTADGSVTLFSAAQQECYHSVYGAATESRLLFLEYSGLCRRLADGLDSRVLEIGFGTGFNFLLSAAEACKHRHSHPDTRLIYHALEHRPVPAPIITRLARHNLPHEPLLVDALDTILSRSRYNDSSPQGPQAPITGMINSNVALSLTLADATTYPIPASNFNIVFLDAFSVDSNAALWRAEFLGKLRKHMATDGQLVTFSVNRKFREALDSAGFSWKRLPGPPGKRQVMVAQPAHAAVSPAS